MRKLMKILTPENVYVEYELAGLGSRFAALVIDHLIQALFVAVIAAGMLFGGAGQEYFDWQNSILVAAGIILIFIIMFGYFIFFEMIMNGQSPGKKLLKLRVVRQNGQPVGFFDSFLRNIFRLADMLPSLNLTGAAFIVFSKQYSRIGDYISGTIVIRHEKNNMPVTLRDLLKDGVRSSQQPEPNIYPVNKLEYGVLREYLARKNSLGDRRPVFKYHLGHYFMRKFNEVKRTDEVEDFLEQIVRMNSGV